MCNVLASTPVHVLAADTCSATVAAGYSRASQLCNAGSFGPAYGTYMAFTLAFAALATLPVTSVAQGGLADGSGVSELQVRCC